MYCYQLNNDGEVYTSKIKAHKRLCNVLGKDEDDFLPHKEAKHDRCAGWVVTFYPNGYTITKRPLL